MVDKKSCRWVNDDDGGDDDDDDVSLLMQLLRESFFHVLLASYRPGGFERVYRSGDSKLMS